MAQKMVVIRISCQTLEKNIHKKFGLKICIMPGAPEFHCKNAAGKTTVKNFYQQKMVVLSIWASLMERKMREKSHPKMSIMSGVPGPLYCNGDGLYHWKIK